MLFWCYKVGNWVGKYCLVVLVIGVLYIGLYEFNFRWLVVICFELWNLVLNRMLFIFFFVSIFFCVFKWVSVLVIIILNVFFLENLVVVVGVLFIFFNIFIVLLRSVIFFWLKFFLVFFVGVMVVGDLFLLFFVIFIVFIVLKFFVVLWIIKSNFSILYYF